MNINLFRNANCKLTDAGDLIPAGAAKKMMKTLCSGVKIASGEGTKILGFNSDGDPEFVVASSPTPVPEDITIGTQTWKTANLAIDDGQGGVVIEDGIYYYSYEAAVRIASSITGWKLPSLNDWYTLFGTVVGKDGYEASDGQSSTNKHKTWYTTTSDQDDDIVSAWSGLTSVDDGGTNSTGFNSVKTGCYNFANTQVVGKDYGGMFWSSDSVSDSYTYTEEGSFPAPTVTYEKYAQIKYQDVSGLYQIYEIGANTIDISSTGYSPGSYPIPYFAVRLIKDS